MVLSNFSLFLARPLHDPAQLIDMMRVQQEMLRVQQEMLRSVQEMLTSQEKSHVGEKLFRSSSTSL